MKDNSGNSKAFGHCECKKALAVCAPVVVVRQPWPESNHHS